MFPRLIADSGGTIYLVLILQGDVYGATGCGFLGEWYIRTVGSDVSIPPLCLSELEVHVPITPFPKPIVNQIL